MSVVCVALFHPALGGALHGTHVALQPTRDLEWHGAHACSQLATASGREVGTIAEVGVWKGGNAKVLYDTFKPKKFFLVDPWMETTDPRYVAANEDIVKRLFAPQVADHTVTTVKGFSTEWLPTLA